MPDIPVVFALSLVLIVVFGIYERHLARHTSRPPIVDLAIFSRHGYKVTAVLALSFSAITAITVSAILHAYTLTTRRGGCT